jgi:Domain of unknown function (DUF397)
MDDIGDVLQWRKSSSSGTGDCVEVAIDRSHVHLRDSEQPAGAQLHLTHAEWNAFVRGVKAGEFDVGTESSD